MQMNLGADLRTAMHDSHAPSLRSLQCASMYSTLHYCGLFCLEAVLLT